MAAATATTSNQMAEEGSRWGWGSASGSTFTVMLPGVGKLDYQLSTPQKG